MGIRSGQWSGSKKADRNQADRPRNYSVIGRLRPAVPLSAAEADKKTLQAQLAKSYTDPNVRESRDGVIIQRYADTVVDASLKRAPRPSSGGRRSPGSSPAST